VAGLDTKEYRFVAAGPTTSIREEPYQGMVMKHFNIKGVIGKGGMGPKTLAACQEVPGVYLHAIGGAASLIAQTVSRVLGVYKLDFGVPEAMWVTEVKDFPAVVTMDSHGGSLHASVEAHSKAVLQDSGTGVNYRLGDFRVYENLSIYESHEGGRSLEVRSTPLLLHHFQ
jgi:fumarate hydratase class I